VVGTVTVIGIFSFFCILVRLLSIRAPFLNAIQIHECLVFHVVPDLLTRSALFSVTAAWHQMLYWHEQRNAIT
jgi:hypothetical protein